MNCSRFCKVNFLVLATLIKTKAGHQRSCMRELRIFEFFTKQNTSPSVCVCVCLCPFPSLGQGFTYCSGERLLPLVPSSSHALLGELHCLCRYTCRCIIQHVFVLSICVSLSIYKAAPSLKSKEKRAVVTRVPTPGINRSVRHT